MTARDPVDIDLGRYLDAEEARESYAEEFDRLHPIVLAERRDAIRAELAKPGSDIDKLTLDCWSDTLVMNQFETLIRIAASTPAEPFGPGESPDKKLGRLFRGLCDQCVDFAAREGLDKAIEARIQQESKEFA